MAGDENLSKDRGIRLIDFLSSLNQLRRKIYRDLNEYENVLLLHEIPKEPKYCFTQAWGENEDFDQDIWIEIKNITSQKSQVFLEYVKNG